jgi:hypothetical protein
MSGSGQDDTAVFLDSGQPGFPGPGDLPGPWRLDASLQAGGMEMVFSESRAAVMTQRFEQERQLLAR